MNALYWNCRGLGNENTRSMLFDFATKNKPIVVGIAEPKVPFTSLPRRFLDNMGYSFIEDCHGHLQNLWVLVRKESARSCSIISKTDQQITVSISSYGVSTTFTMVYGNCKATTRRLLWHDLLNIKGMGISNWFVMGDFNICLGAHEKMGGAAPRIGNCRDFREAIDNCDLSDLEPTGPLLTWTNKQDDGAIIQIRLDRILHDEKALEGWDSVKCNVLPRHCSDHSPLLLICKKRSNNTTTPFRFRSMWVDHQNFFKDTEEFWKSMNIMGNPVYVLQNKLKNLRNFLRGWNKTVFGNIDKEMNLALQNLTALQEEMSKEGCVEEITKKEAVIHDRINFLLESRKKLQYDACKVKWLQQGDRNSAFFHALHARKKTTSGISLLKCGDDDLTEDASVIEKEILSFYENLFNTNDPSPCFDSIQEVIPSLITGADNLALLRVPSTEEIKDTVFLMDSFSAPGPDGFTGLFFKKCWNFVGPDVSKAIQYMFSTRSFPAGINSTFMTLIPKVDDALSIEQYRPIALGNFLFKVVTKLVGDRLAKIVPKILSPNQFGFVKGRHIENCIAGVSECFNLMNRKCIGDSLAFKIDIRKAFDTMRWDFIIQVLRAFGFCDNFCSWVSNLLLSARISVLINGTPKGYFKCSRGVRQGDPISPLLFVIAEDFLSRLILQRVSEKRIDPIKSTRGFCPSHFLYADDVILFCKASAKNAKAIKEIFRDYGLLSGQLVNNNKSSLFFSSSISSRISSRVRQILEVGEGHPNFTYLGVPIFRGKVRRAHLRSIHDSVLAKFSNWKGNTLSIMGRIALVRSVIYGSLMHSFMIYRWPISLLKEMEKGIKCFIWTGNILSKSKTSVSWDKCCKAKDEGGLGLRKLKPLNEALLAKFAFNIIGEKGLSQDLLKARFIHRGTTWNCPISSTIWLSIKKSFKQVFHCCQWIPGSSSTLDFWTDNWLGYRIIDRLQSSQGSQSQLRGLIKEARPNGLWDIPNQHLLGQDVIKDVHSTLFGRQDVFVCRISVDGKASVKDFYRHFQEPSTKNEWGKFIWKQFILPSRSFQFWRFMHKRTQVDEMFMKQGVQMVSRCSLCLTHMESLNHLFFECSFASGLWDFLMGIFDRPYVPTHPWDLFNTMNNSGLSSQLWTLWQVGFFECIWLIWHVRNQIRHEEKHVNLQTARKLILQAMAAAKVFRTGTMHNTIQDLLILRKIGVQGVPRAPKLTILVFWCPPPKGVIKISTDGAVSSGKTAAGGVFRLHNGSVLAAFSSSIPLCSALEAEIHAILIATKQVIKLGLKHVWFETDSMILFNKLSSRTPDVPWTVRREWEDLLLQLCHINFTISHIYREGNRVADFFANLGFVQPNLYWWRHFPHGVIDLLNSDAISLGSFRIR